MYPCVASVCITGIRFSWLSVVINLLLLLPVASASANGSAKLVVEMGEISVATEAIQ